jgi:hypothetical protein
MPAILTTVTIVEFAANAIWLVRPAALAIAALPNAFNVLRLFTAVSGCLALGEDLLCARLECEADRS